MPWWGCVRKCTFKWHTKHPNTIGFGCKCWLHAALIPVNTNKAPFIGAFSFSHHIFICTRPCRSDPARHAAGEQAGYLVSFTLPLPPRLPPAQPRRTIQKESPVVENCGRRRLGVATYWQRLAWRHQQVGAWRYQCRWRRR